MNLRLPARSALAAFTMVEIALSLAIIGFALVAIVGVLPQGLNIQRDNREDTLVSQDGPFILECIRSGAKGIEALTNSVDRIDVVTRIFPDQLATNRVSRFFLQESSSNILGVLSIPVGTDVNLPQEGAKAKIHGSLVSVLTVMRPLGGPAVDSSPVSRDLAFRYMIESKVVSAPDTANYQGAAGPLHTISLKFYWPYVDGRVGGRGQQVFRTQFAGVISSPPVAGATTNGVTYFARPLVF
jgi:type II secretory pathway pseudopilin PulG